MTISTAVDSASVAADELVGCTSPPTFTGMIPDGRSAAGKDAIQRAVSTLDSDRTADWVTSGMALHGSGSNRNANVNVYQATRLLIP